MYVKIIYVAEDTLISEFWFQTVTGHGYLVFIYIYLRYTFVAIYTHLKLY